MKDKKLPELLAPAGSREAFEAAIEGGADAIYIGGASFNARINAKNFSSDELCDAVRLAHAYGVKVYQTINIMTLDREMSELEQTVINSANAGVDAFIVSDLGAAARIHRILPDMPLHASTQMSIHNAEGAKLLENYGFSRVVPARELSREDMSSLVKNNPLEVEIFIHGAMCVSHSGQCLFSSLVGGRSGNRGLCAQPCRLPYSANGCKGCDKYPLSLKDMSLATHVREIIDSGVASLKIEGRMKSPEYVRGVTSIWRRLLDEGRDAMRADIDELAALFSRGGFSDGYYEKRIDRKMLGVRSDEDKQASREIDKFNKITRKIPLDIKARVIEGEPMALTLSSCEKKVTVTGEVAQKAINAPLNVDAVTRSMSKLGDSVFKLGNIEVELGEQVMAPVSQMNSLRRAGVEAMTAALAENPVYKVEKTTSKKPTGKRADRRVARFASTEQITDKAREYFDVCLLPLDKFVANGSRADGFVMPPVIFDSEVERVSSLLEKVTRNAPEYAVVSNLGQIELVKKHLPEINTIADFRFNIGNDETVAFLEELGFESVIASAELTLPQIRDLGGSVGAIVYGRIPLMTLEKCVIKELYGDKSACEVCSQGNAEMRDRRGFVFPVVREYPHRNIVLNSLPTSMSDRQDELDRARISDRHFIFTVESADEVDEVVDDFKRSRAPSGKVRRI